MGKKMLDVGVDSKLELVAGAAVNALMVLVWQLDAGSVPICRRVAAWWLPVKRKEN